MIRNNFNSSSTRIKFLALIVCISALSMAKTEIWVDTLGRKIEADFVKINYEESSSNPVTIDVIFRENKTSIKWELLSEGSQQKALTLSKAGTAYSDLQTLFVEKADVLLDIDFSGSETYNGARRTTCKVVDEVLTIVSPNKEDVGEYDGKGHSPFEPTAFIKFNKLEEQLHEYGYVLQLDFMIKKGEDKVEFSDKEHILWIGMGHHASQINFKGKGYDYAAQVYKGTNLGRRTKKFKELGDSNTIQFDEWYTLLMEVKGDEAVVRVKGKDPIYHNDEGLTQPSGSLGFCGPEHGEIFVDNIKLHKAGEVKQSWEKVKSTIIKTLQ